MHITKIEMSGIELTGMLSWARYWTLKSLQTIVPCSDLQLHTCPISLELKGDSHFRDVHMRGVCAGKKFTAVCRLSRGLNSDNFTLFSIEVTVEGQEHRFYDHLIPNYPTEFSDKVVTA